MFCCYSGHRSVLIIKDTFVRAVFLNPWLQMKACLKLNIVLDDIFLRITKENKKKETLYKPYSPILEPEVYT